LRQWAARLDVIMRQVEEEILPALTVDKADIDTIREEPRGLLREAHHAVEAEVHILR
jgi:hypothetical protein